MVADANHVRKTGNLPDGVAATVILPYLRLASRRVQRLLASSEVSYAEAEIDAAANLDLDGNVDFTATEDDTASVGDLEAFLTLAAGLNAFNTVMETAGTTAAGVTQEGVVGENTYRYLTPSEVKTKADDYLNKADLLLDVLGVSSDSGSPGPGISYALDPDGEEIDADYPD